MRKLIPIKERFESKIFHSPCGCWFWTASVRPDGYGQIMTKKGLPRKANRAAWEIYRGQIPEGLFVCHTCDNKLCVNPDHLFLGTALDNVRDMDRKGRRVVVSNHGEKHGCAKLKAYQVLEIRALKDTGLKHWEIAARYNVTRTMIGYILKGTNWTKV